MMPSKNNGFTESDFERYHSGKMTPQERHALEKAALDDPFLADALEGYAFTSTAASDLAKIQSRLNERLDKKKAIPFFQKYKWLSAAAIVLIIAGAGWIVYDISNRENKSLTALERKQPVKDSATNFTSPQKVINDSANKNARVTKEESTEKKQLTVTTNNSNKNKRDSFAFHVNEKAKNADDKEVTVINNKADVVSKAVSAPSYNEAASADSPGNNQRSYTNMNTAVSIEPRLNKASNNIADKNIFLKKAEKNNTNPAGKVNDKDANDTIKNLNIVLKPLPTDSLKEVVITGYGTQKKATEKYPRVIIDTLEPEEGYVNFGDYVANNLKMPEEIRNKPASGEVQLSFDVDKDGQPTNITVVKSLCQKCDEEAIRLLKEGPKWKKKKNLKGIITFRF